MNEAELRQALIVKELENLKADMNENLCSIACEDCPFNDLHFYAKSGCRVTDFIDSHIAKIKENKQ